MRPALPPDERRVPLMSRVLPRTRAYLDTIRESSDGRRVDVLLERLEQSQQMLRVLWHVAGRLRKKARRG